MFFCRVRRNFLRTSAARLALQSARSSLKNSSTPREKEERPLFDKKGLPIEEEQVTATTGVFHTPEDATSNAPTLFTFNQRTFHNAPPETFYFNNSSSGYCKLCHEEVQSQKFHLWSAARSSHLNHTVREVVMDHLTFLARRGVPLTCNIAAGWEQVLLRFRDFQRIDELVEKGGKLQARIKNLVKHLTTLKEMGVVDLALARTDVGDRREAFERYEYIGDNNWGANISNRIMLLFAEKQWVWGHSAHYFNAYRDACEMNINLEFVFDSLCLQELMTDELPNGKKKADVVEALFGELFHYTWGLEPLLYSSGGELKCEINGIGEARLLALIHHCINELYDLMVLVHAAEMSETAIPLAQELASKSCWMAASISRQRERNRTLSAGGGLLGRVVTLPATLKLHSSATPMPVSIQPHPLSDVVAPEYLNPAGEDTLATLIQLLKEHGNVDGALRFSAVATPSGTKVRRSEFPAQFDQLVAGMRLPLQGDDCAHLVPVDLEPHELYFRDKMLDLWSAREGIAQEVCSSAIAAVRRELAVEPLFPWLTEKPVGDVARRVSLTSEEPFVKSALVPDELKPPTGGVVLENWRNICFGKPAIEPKTVEEIRAMMAEDNEIFALKQAPLFSSVSSASSASATAK